VDPRIGLTAAEKGEMSVTDRSQNLVPQLSSLFLGHCSG
jgi:hypothetical protein